MKCQTDSLLQT